MSGKQAVQEYRKPEVAAHEIFLNRWSPRAMSGEAMAEHDLMPLFEAAKWAPSSYNNQPWRFLYALKNGSYWSMFLNLLMEANKGWVKNAAALVVVISKTTFDHNGKPSRTHSFDAGAAWENLALQGSLSGFAVHGMQGFDYEAARKELDIPADYEVEAMIAIGKPGSKEELPPQLQEREIPSGRKSLSQIAAEGKFRFS